MTPLANAILRQIRAQGPITVAEYMTLCLLHPEHGYYTQRDPLGVDGDFTTAPEISQMFGEILGIGLAQAWLDQGEPTRFTLAELGPGRGTLMADLMRATARLPGFAAAAEMHLIEASPALRAAQADRLAQYAPRWHEHVEALPDQPLLLIANEFFDALPIRQFLRQGDAWAERMICEQGGKLAFGLSPPAPLAALAHRLEDTDEGQMVETCAPAIPIIESISARIARHGGLAWIIDYGDWRSRGDTLQALRAHRPADPLDTPGAADLTAHVDFEAIARAAHPLRATRLTPQGVVLERLGITARAQSLAHGLAGSALDSHIAAHRRLTHPQEMGQLFKMLGLTRDDAPTPPGFDA